MYPMIGEPAGPMLDLRPSNDGETGSSRRSPMSPISNISTVKFAFAVAALLGAVAAGLAIRGAASVDVPLGAMDDYGNRHAVVAESRLTLNDDFGTRNQAPASELTLNDDFGTRNQPARTKLTAADDFGTRHITPATKLGPNDDYATR